MHPKHCFLERKKCLQKFCFPEFKHERSLYYMLEIEVRQSQISQELEPLKNILPEHLEDLEKSGLAQETISKAGLYSLEKEELEKALGFKLPEKENYTGLAFPYSKDFVRYKIFPPVVWKEDEKPVKYLQAKASGVHVYFPQDIDLSVDTPLYFTEGEKKALKAVQSGLNCIGLGGIWNWKNATSERPIDEITAIPFLNREVFLVPDSDFSQNNMVMLAVYRLGVQLEKMGAKVAIIALESTTNEKLGLDDFLCIEGTLIEDCKRINLKHKIFKANDCHKKAKKKELEIKTGGEPQKIIEKIKSLKYQFRYNVVLCEIEYTCGGSDWLPFADRKLNNLLLSMRSFEEFKRIPENVLLSTINSDLLSPEYDPFALFFEQNKWDGQDRFKTFISLLTPKNPDPKNWGEKSGLIYRWLINATGTLLGEVNNEACLVLQGQNQGMGKTTWLNSLFSKIPELEKYLTVEKIIDSRNVDSKRMLCERGLINLDELDGLSKSQVESVKMIFSLNGVNYRIPFDRFAGKKKRRANFCGSSNETQFLTDGSGSRRWFIIPILGVNIEGITGIDFRQLWAQAYTCYKDNFKYWLNQTQIGFLNASNEEHYKPTVAEELLLAKCRVPQECLKEDYFTTTELAKIITGSEDTPKDSFIQQLGRALSNRGYSREYINRLYRWKIEFLR
jgi:hypothetical protein